MKQVRHSRVVALLVTKRLGELELGKQRAAGWPEIVAPESRVQAGRILYFAAPDGPFDLRSRWIARGLRIMMCAQAPCSAEALQPPPIWVYRLLRPSGSLRKEMAEALLDELEVAAISAGTMPRHLRSDGYS